MALKDNLIAYYKCNQGALLVDSSGNGKTLTNNNSVAEASDGKFGYCADYGTTLSSKSLSRSDALSISTQNFTINMWVKYSALPAPDTIMTLFSIRVNGTKTQFEFDYRKDAGGTLKYNVWTGTGGGLETSSNVTESIDTYYMLTLTYDNSNLRLYRNNSLIITQSTGTETTSASTQIQFGNIATSLNRQLKGKLDEIACYNRVITSGEMTELYGGGNGKEISFNSSNFLQMF